MILKASRFKEHGHNESRFQDSRNEGGEINSQGTNSEVSVTPTAHAIDSDHRDGKTPFKPCIGQPLALSIHLRLTLLPTHSLKPRETVLAPTRWDATLLRATQ